MKIAIIGCGHMGSAIASALMRQKFRIIAGNPIKPGIKCAWTADNTRAAKSADIILIAVKPGAVAPVLAEIKPFLNPKQLLISIAAGVSLRSLKKWSGHKKIARVMPNLPAQVLDGMSVWKTAKTVTKKEKKHIMRLLTSFGKHIEVNDEKLIDGATAISGSGPAYVAAFLESLADIAQKIGFSKKDARMLALEMTDGTLDYIKETGVEFTALKKAVQTKGGTTEAAFKVLKQNKWQKIFGKALMAGYKRTRKISGK